MADVLLERRARLPLGIGRAYRVDDLLHRSARAAETVGEVPDLAGPGNDAFLYLIQVLGHDVDGVIELIEPAGELLCSPGELSQPRCYLLHSPCEFLGPALEFGGTRGERARPGAQFFRPGSKPAHPAGELARSS